MALKILFIWFIFSILLYSNYGHCIISHKSYLSKRSRLKEKIKYVTILLVTLPVSIFVFIFYCIDSFGNIKKRGENDDILD
jgi:hypothetical protein